MIELVAAGFAVLSAAGLTSALGWRRAANANWDTVMFVREERNEAEARVAQLTKLLMAREAPQEFAAYMNPTSLAEEFPADAVWSDDGLFYMVPGEA